MTTEAEYPITITTDGVTASDHMTPGAVTLDRHSRPVMQVEKADAQSPRPYTLLCPCGRRFADEKSHLNHVAEEVAATDPSGARNG